MFQLARVYVRLLAACLANLFLLQVDALNKVKIGLRVPYGLARRTGGVTFNLLATRRRLAHLLAHRGLNARKLGRVTGGFLRHLFKAHACCLAAKKGVQHLVHLAVGLARGSPYLFKGFRTANGFQRRADGLRALTAALKYRLEVLQCCGQTRRAAAVLQRLTNAFNGRLYLFRNFVCSAKFLLYLVKIFCDGLFQT